MATRPAWKYEDKLVKRRNFDFEWNPGQAPSQKKKNIQALHEAINESALEVSTKSDDDLGQRLSPFNLTIKGKPMESVYHASKIFENGGPYPEIADLTARRAKRDPRIKESGEVIGFRYKDEDFPLRPLSSFFNYLYYLAVKESIPEEELKEILNYTYFTDIEFNPNKSVSNQARAITIVKALLEEYGELPELTAQEYFEFEKPLLDEVKLWY